MNAEMEPLIAEIKSLNEEYPIGLIAIGAEIEQAMAENAAAAPTKAAEQSPKRSRAPRR